MRRHITQRQWSRKEMDALLTWYGKEPAKETAKRIPHRSEQAIADMARKFKLCKKLTVWTPEKLTELRTHMGKEPIAATVARFKSTERAVRSAASRHGIISGGFSRRRWARADVERLEDKYFAVTARVLADQMKRSPGAVRKKASGLGLAEMRESGQ